MIRAMKPFLAAALFLLLAACAAQTPQSVALPSAPPSGEPSGYAGLAASELRTAFGAPAFVRKEGTTEIWRYDSPRCRAFFFLYGQTGAQTVRHVETLPRGATMAADTTCLDAMRAPARVS